MGGLLAAAAAWAIGKIALGLRSDYLAIATLGIAEIILSVMKNEDWLARGVKNIIDLPRPWPVPYEVDLQQSAGFLAWAADWGHRCRPRCLCKALQKSIQASPRDFPEPRAR